MRIIRTDSLTPESISLMSDFDRDSTYNGLDSCVTLEVFHAIEGLLDNTSRHTYEFSKSLQGPVFEMQTRGLRVDFERREHVLNLYRKKIETVSEQLDKIVHEGIGVHLNWRSPTQLKKLLYEVIGLKPIKKKNAQGIMAPTVNREALEELQKYMLAEPICIRLLYLRDLDKKRMFLESEVDPDGRIRTNFNIAGTTTGRLASAISDFGTGTNLQNVDTELRSVFIADPGMAFINLDLEQGDARNVGAICWNLLLQGYGERFAGSYLDACESGDLHTTVCKMAWTNLPWGTAPDKEIAGKLAYRQDSYRQLAKKLGHGSNYMGQPPTMAKHTKLPENLVSEFQRRYFTAFQCIPTWHRHRIEELKTTGRITTLLGRRRTFFGRAEDPATQREMIAYEPQSLTADEIDTGIINLFRANVVQIMLQVHDSTLIQVPEDRVDELVPLVKRLLLVPITLLKGREFAVPVDAKVGWNWGEAREDNPDGLAKYKESDARKRQVPVHQTLQALLR